MPGKPNQRKSKQRLEKRAHGPSLLEWISGGVGLVITLGLVGFIVAEALQPGIGKPPVLLVEPVEFDHSAAGYVVVVEVSNDSGQTAADVTVEGSLLRAAGPRETSTATIAYVPAHSKRRAGLVFREDPRELGLRVRATGYEEP